MSRLAAHISALCALNLLRQTLDLLYTNNHIGHTILFFQPKDAIQTARVWEGEYCIGSCQQTGCYLTTDSATYVKVGFARDCGWRLSESL